MVLEQQSPPRPDVEVWAPNPPRTRFSGVSDGGGREGRGGERSRGKGGASTSRKTLTPKKTPAPVGGGATINDHMSYK
jgi:hypothetical protein